METQLFDANKWLNVEVMIGAKFGKTPNLEAILFIIGIQESGQVKSKFSKEQKQDLMHIAICRLFEPDGYFRFDGLDEDGWPHYTNVKPVPDLKGKEQEGLLKKQIITYFEQN